MDYINKLRADIQQLEDQIEDLNEKIDDASFSNSNDLLVLLLKINSLNDRLTSKQSQLIRSILNRLQSESDRLDRMFGIAK